MWNRHKKTQCNEVHAWNVHTADWVLFNNWRFWTFTCWNRQRRAYTRLIITSTSKYDIVLMWNYVTRVKVKPCGKNSRSGQIGACSHSDLMVSACTEFRWFQQFWRESTYIIFLCCYDHCYFLTLYYVKSLLHYEQQQFYERHLYKDCLRFHVGVVSNP